MSEEKEEEEKLDMNDIPDQNFSDKEWASSPLTPHQKELARLEKKSAKKLGASVSVSNSIYDVPIIQRPSTIEPIVDNSSAPTEMVLTTHPQTEPAAEPAQSFFMHATPLSPKEQIIIDSKKKLSNIRIEMDMELVSINFHDVAIDEMGFSEDELINILVKSLDMGYVKERISDSVKKHYNQPRVTEGDR